jgi:4-carboxymuconolactone decarboxylase
MTGSDRPGRREAALRTWAEVFGNRPEAPGDPFTAAFLDFAFGEVWNRGGLARRDRFLLALACLAADALEAQLKPMVRAALGSGDLTVDELHEAMLHLAAYVGFPPLTSIMRNAINEAAVEQGVRVTPPGLPASGEERRAYGLRAYAEATGRAPAPPEDPLRAAAMDFVTAEVWRRPGLAHRDRRLLTMAVLTRAGLRAELRVHVRAALRGEFTVPQLEEAALHLSVYLGFPRAGLLQATVTETAAG